MFDLCYRLLRGLTYRRRYYLFWQGNPICCRFDSSDYNVFQQVFINEEYGCFNDAKAPALIIDCGANVGYSSVYFLSHFPQAQLIAIEPDGPNFQMCRWNLRPFNKRASVYQAAIWPSSSNLKIVKMDDRDAADWAIQVKKCLGEEKGAVKGVNIADLLEKSGFKHIDILKVDIEGAEKEIFAHNYQGWLIL